MIRSSSFFLETNMMPIFMLGVAKLPFLFTIISSLNQNSPSLGISSVGGIGLEPPWTSSVGGIGLEPPWTSSVGGIGLEPTTSSV
jgi:hypothetical protein